MKNQLNKQNLYTNIVCRLISALIFLTTLNVNAAWFGASTYEECMIDGKIGRTNAELTVLRQYCMSKFPKKANKKIAKLFTIGKSNIRCVINAQAYDFKIENGFVEHKNERHKILFKDDNEIMFNMQSYTLEDINNASKRAKAAGDIEAANEIKGITEWLGKDESVLYNYKINSNGLFEYKIIGNNTKTRYYESGKCVEE